MLSTSGKYAKFLGVGLCLSYIVGCSTNSSPLERLRITTKIIYAVGEALNVVARGWGDFGLSKVNGFYDPVRNEIWCPNSETNDPLHTCGHGLRHWIRGQFHH